MNLNPRRTATAGQAARIAAGATCGELERCHFHCSVLSWLQLRLALSCCIDDPQRGRLLRPPRQTCFADTQNARSGWKAL